MNIRKRIRKKEEEINSTWENEVRTHGKDLKRWVSKKKKDGVTSTAKRWRGMTTCSKKGPTYIKHSRE